MSARILVIDDEPALCEILTDLLELEGHSVTACNDRSSAELALDSTPFDIAMTDVFLSDGPFGIDVAKHILTHHPETRVILMTGYADRADVEAACISGAFTCMAKPFNLDDVIKVLNTAMAAPSATQSN